jgi:hypothetical protein
MKQTNLSFNTFLDLKTISRKSIKNLITFKKGIYFWFASFDAIQKMGITNVNNWQKEIYGEREYYLIYIGIGPRDENTRKQFLPQRITNCHLGNKITNSTFRLSIASILGMEGFTKQVGKNLKYFLDDKDENDINEFIENNFCIGLINDPCPWLNEETYIHRFQPPLNLQHNTKGWFYNTMDQSRKTFQSNAKSKKI